MKIHEIYIKRCIQLSKNGLVAAMPNPSVGAVIVFDGKIIGEGYTSPYGGNHAEVNAINAVIDKSLLAKSTIYVSLEPCSHFGKTPPCSDLIIKYKIPTVIIGITDSNNKVAGNGIKKLTASGINVIVGVLEKECKEANKRFFTFHEKKRPYILLKWAETRDGFIAPLENEIEKSLDNRKPIFISNQYSRQLVHKYRSEEQAILVGTTTVIADNPKLDTRDWFGKNPIRIVLDKNNRIPKESHIFDNSVKTVIISQENINFNNNVASEIVNYLFKNNIQSVLIEGGSKTLQTFIDADYWDEAFVFKSNMVFSAGKKAPKLRHSNYFISKIKNDKLITYRNL